MTNPLRQALETPWMARNELRRYWSLPRVRLVFLLSGIEWGKGWHMYGEPIIQRHRGGSIHLGDRLTLRSALWSNPLAPAHPVVLSVRRPGALLTVGADFGMTGGTLCADTSIMIGDRVSVGANCTIIDTDFHPLDLQQRQRDLQQRQQSPTAQATAPIMIEDDVFIGMACLILKGSQIGAGTIIGAGSVVTGTIPPGVIAAGNPARVIRPVGSAAG